MVVGEAIQTPVGIKETIYRQQRMVVVVVVVVVKVLHKVLTSGTH